MINNSTRSGRRWRTTAVLTRSIQRRLRSESQPCGRAIAFFKMRIGWHGLGVLAMAVLSGHSHGHPEDGKSVAPQIKKGDCPGVITNAFASFKLDDLV